MFKEEKARIVYRYALVNINKKAKYKTIIDENVCIANKYADEKMQNKYMYNELKEMTDFSYKHIHPYIKNLDNLSPIKSLKKTLSSIKGKRIDVYTIITDTNFDQKNKTVSITMKLKLTKNATPVLKQRAKMIEKLSKEDLNKFLKKINIENLQVMLPELYDLIKKDGWKLKQTYIIGSKIITYTIDKNDLN